MFTGIVTQMGTIESVVESGEGARIALRAVGLTAELGESIAVDGTCLTALEPGEGRFEADLSRETLDRTNLGRRRPGDMVNLERCLRPADRFGGHFVLGHVDATATVVALERAGDEARLVVQYPERYHRLVVEKGSVAVNGVSLTIASCEGNRFSVALIAFTLAETNLGRLATADPVNLEFDYLAKLVVNALDAREAADDGRERE